jgi:ribonuclease P protein component
MTVGRLRTRRSFELLARHGIRARHGTVTVWFRPSDEAPAARVGYAIGKPTGSAVDRNRLRRRLRAMIDSLELPPGDYLVRAGVEAAGLGPDDLRRDLTGAVAKVAELSTEAEVSVR